MLNTYKHSYNTFSDEGVLSVCVVRLGDGYHVNYMWLKQLLFKHYNLKDIGLDKEDFIALNLGDLIGNHSNHDVFLVHLSFIKQTFNEQIFPDLYNSLDEVFLRYAESEGNSYNPQDVTNGKEYPINTIERESVQVTEPLTKNVLHGIKTFINVNGKILYHTKYLAYIMVTTPTVIEALVKNDAYYVPSEIYRQGKDVYITIELFLSVLLRNPSYNSVMAVKSGIGRLKKLKGK